MKHCYVTAQFFMYGQHNVQREATHLDMQTHNFIKISSWGEKNNKQTPQQQQQKPQSILLNQNINLKKKIQQYDKPRMVRWWNDQNLQDYIKAFAHHLF